MNVGDKVIDDLTGDKSVVLEILSMHGVRIDSDYFDGYRYDWEITVIE